MQLQARSDIRIFCVTKLCVKQFQRTRSTPVRRKKCEKACAEAIDRRRNPIPSCLIGQHLVLIIEMIRTLGVSNRLYCWQWHTHAHIWAAARPVNLSLSLIAAAAAHSPHLSNAMINKYLIKFGVSNGEFTKHTLASSLSPRGSFTRFVCVHDSILVNSQGNTPERVDLVFFMYLAQVRPVLQHLKIHTLTRQSASQRSSHDSCISSLALLSLLHTSVDSSLIYAFRSFFLRFPRRPCFGLFRRILSSREKERAHLFIVLIYGNNFICRKAAGNIPREREER